MCCNTHEFRDGLMQLDELKPLLASNDKLRCQCSYGNPCQRQATAEDMKCTWCRDHPNHARWCNAHMNTVFINSPSYNSHYSDVIDMNINLRWP